jgi:hypothetical protein
VRRCREFRHQSRATRVVQHARAMAQQRDSTLYFVARPPELLEALPQLLQACKILQRLNERDWARQNLPHRLKPVLPNPHRAPAYSFKPKSISSGTACRALVRTISNFGVRHCP